MPSKRSPISRALLVKPHWADLIVSGKKTWELRSRKTGKHGECIGIVRSGGSHVIGSAVIEKVVGPLSLEELLASKRRHRASASQLKDAFGSKPIYAWVLRDARKLREPLEISRRPGQVIWVKVYEALAPRPVRAILGTDRKGDVLMAKGQQRSNKEKRKPKKDKDDKKKK